MERERLNQLEATEAVPVADDENEGWTSVDRTREQRLARIFEKNQEITGEVVLKKLSEVREGERKMIIFLFF